MPEKIIILNGTACAGKSSIANELKNILTDFHHLKLDDFMDGMPASLQGYSADADLSKIGYYFKFSEDQKTVLDYTILPKGYLVMERVHAAISAFCSEQTHVIYDTVLFNHQLIKDAAQKFSKQEVFFVGVRCDEATRKQREISRGHPIEGMHKINADFIYNECQYDFEVDTTNQTALEAAKEVAKMLDLVAPNVFQNILKDN